MVGCIRLCLNCADVCPAAAGVVSRLVPEAVGIAEPYGTKIRPLGMTSPSVTTVPTLPLVRSIVPRELAG